MTIPRFTSLILSRSKKPEAASPQNLVPAQDKAGKEAPFATPAYNQVARAAKLRSMAVSCAEFFVLPDFYATREKDPEWDLNLTFTAEVSHEIFNAAEGVASCEWTWSVHSKVGRKTALSIKATYIVIYSNLHECEQEAVTAYMRRVGRLRPTHISGHM